MFKCIPVALLTLLLAATPAFAGGIGVFNSQSIMAQSEPSKAAQKELQSRFGSEGTRIENQLRDIQKQGQSFQSQAAAMSQKAREEKQVDLMRRGRELEEKRRSFAVEVDKARSAMSQVMFKLVLDASANVAKKRNLDLILDANTGSITYAADSLDVSKDLLDEVNRLWKGMGSKFPAPEKAQQKSSKGKK